MDAKTFQKFEYVRNLGLMEDYESVNLRVEDGKLYYKLTRRNNFKSDIKEGFSQTTVEEFVTMLDSLKIDSWKDEYEPQGVYILDGESWRVDLKEKGKKKRRITGDNAYPANWKTLRNIIVRVTK